MKESIGIDVSMDTLDVAFYDGKSFKVVRYENNEADFLKLETELTG